MQKMSFTNNETALGYAIYMIVGSYFNSAKAVNRTIEKKMYVQYHEQKLNDQYKMEEACEKYVIRNLIPAMPAEFWKQDVDVRFICEADGKVSGVWFVTPENVIAFHPGPDGRKTSITHKVWSKKAS